MKETMKNPVYYFGFGSNLWRKQMSRRCPSSPYIGIARLQGWKWIINERGYANVVETSSSSTASSLTREKRDDDNDEVWGLVYCLSEADEAQLDLNEGVPEAYGKENLEIELWKAEGEEDQGHLKGSAPLQSVDDQLSTPPVKVDGLVYVDRKRTTPDVPKKEYIFRMNMGIKDALKEGVPAKYVDEVLRKFIPDVEDRTVEEFAWKQALLFEDER